MKNYCVVRGTTKVIDNTSRTVEFMLQNAQNAGFSENEIEILTEEEYLQRLESEPKLPQVPTAEDRIEALELALLEVVLGG